MVKFSRIFRFGPQVPRAAGPRSRTTSRGELFQRLLQRGKGELVPQPIRPLGCFLWGLGVESCLRVVACCGSLIDPCCTHRNCYKKVTFSSCERSRCGTSCLKLRKCIRRGRRGTSWQSGQECEVWSVKIWSGECEVCSAECEV